MTAERDRLGVGIGRYVTGGHGHTDVAFEAFKRTVARMAEHATFDWFITRVEALESELDSIGGFDQALVDAFDGPEGYMCSAEAVDRYERMTGLAADIEEFASAFFVTLQTRLAAVRSLGVKVYEAALRDNLLNPPRRAAKQVLTGCDDVWELANYVKHRDEWPPILERDSQKQTFNVLVRLGVASEMQGVRRDLPNVVCEAAHRMAGGVSQTSRALQQILVLCAEACNSALTAVEADFDAHSDQLRAIRAIRAASAAST